MTVTTRDEIEAATDVLIAASATAGYYHRISLTGVGGENTREHRIAVAQVASEREALLDLVSPGCEGCVYNLTPMPAPVRCSTCVRYPHGDNYEATP